MALFYVFFFKKCIIRKKYSEISSDGVVLRFYEKFCIIIYVNGNHNLKIESNKDLKSG